MARSGWSEMVADTWRYDVIKHPDEFIARHWSSRVSDDPLRLAIEIESHLENAEKYGAEKKLDEVISLLSKQHCHDPNHGYGCAFEADRDHFIKLIKDNLS